MDEMELELPVNAIVEEVCASLRRHPRLVVTAPPGAGKSTVLPLALMRAFPGGRILMLEPRRIAARQVALRMAEMLREKAGERVGFRVRFESRVSASTRMEVITEGILERMIIDDPTLDGVEAVVFDEFHERSLATDLNVALVLEIQKLIRPDLKILVMSATIDSERLCAAIDAPHLHAEGRNYEVEKIHCGDIEPQDCVEAVLRVVSRAYRTLQGDILVFLPGQGEILECEAKLSVALDSAEIIPLYGLLPAEQQHRALTPSSGARRRIYLATPIAETSLTIPGIRIVVDSGLYRTPVFEPNTGLTKLVTRRISMDMADQRAGRAGRLSSGICHRLWSKAAEARMAGARQPEILTADLSSLLLTVSALGETDPYDLPWVTPPPAGSIANARKLLDQLGAIDGNGKITDKGKRLLQLPCHPRIASMLIAEGKLKSTAADIAALLEAKDPLGDSAESDLSVRIGMLRKYRRGNLPGVWKRIDLISAQYRRMMRVDADNSESNPYEIGRLLANAYPERIAMRGNDGKFRLAGTPASVGLHPEDDLAGCEFIVIASMGQRVYLAAPLERKEVESRSKWVLNVYWDTRAQKVVAREELRLGLLVASVRQPQADVREMAIKAIVAAAPKDGMAMFDFNEGVRELQLRLATVADWHPEMDIPDVSDDSLLAKAAEWLPMYCGKAVTVQELRKIDISGVIRDMLDYDLWQKVERLAPDRLQLPGGRTVRIRYRRGAEAPVVSARLQDCFGLMQTPRVDGGKRAVLMELLSPGFKPVQLTQDLAGFWSSTYFEVRKELRRRYPKHKWPDDPNAV